MIEGADIHDCISVETGVAGAVGAAVIDPKRGFGVVEMLYASTHCLYSSPVMLHSERLRRADYSDAPGIVCPVDA
jgi:hypothetical protein